MFINDYEQMEKLRNVYCTFNVDDLRSGDSNRMIAALNSVAAVLEIISSHISTIARSYFSGLDYTALEKIRNHMRHINGNNRYHNAYLPMSRARRFNLLLANQNPVLLQAFVNFVLSVHSTIIGQADNDIVFFNSFQNCEDIRQRFINKKIAFLSLLQLII